MNARRRFRPGQNFPEVERKAIPFQPHPEIRGDSRTMFRKYQQEYANMTQDEREALNELWKKRAGLTNEEFGKRTDIIKKRNRQNPYERL